jgi:hypothetical protein
MTLQGLTVDCATGVATLADLTPAQAAALAAAQADATRVERALAQQAAQRQADLATVKQFAAANATSPVWQALARLLGAL